jgi:biotin carboxyl carrier protein
MTAFRVTPSRASAVPGDEEHTIDAAAPDAGLRLIFSGPGRGVIGSDVDGEAQPVMIGLDRPATATQARVIEVVVDGWRFELEVEDEARVVLRGRATRERDAGATSGPTEIRAMIPGRVAAVRVSTGDVVEVGQPVLVVEAMKMQNELRATRAGTVERVAVAVGDTIEAGDLLVVVR